MKEHALLTIVSSGRANNRSGSSKCAARCLQ